MTEAATTGQPLTVSALQDLYDRMSTVSIMVAVWCVDRPDAVRRMRELCKTNAAFVRSFASECPVYEWYSRYADEADWARRPDCFHTPGVYMQMTTGKYIKVDV